MVKGGLWSEKLIYGGFCRMFVDAIGLCEYVLVVPINPIGCYSRLIVFCYGQTKPRKGLPQFFFTGYFAYQPTEKGGRKAFYLKQQARLKRKQEVKPILPTGVEQLFGHGCRFNIGALHHFLPPFYHLGIV